jgi:hypothetical protein
MFFKEAMIELPKGVWLPQQRGCRKDFNPSVSGVSQ